MRLEDCSDGLEAKAVAPDLTRTAHPASVEDAGWEDGACALMPDKRPRDMSPAERYCLSGEEKVRRLRLHQLEGKPVSDLCEEL
jgi:hypothetical protein